MVATHAQRVREDQANRLPRTPAAHATAGVIVTRLADAAGAVITRLADAAGAVSFADTPKLGVFANATGRPRRKNSATGATADGTAALAGYGRQRRVRQAAASARRG